MHEIEEAPVNIERYYLEKYGWVTIRDIWLSKEGKFKKFGPLPEGTDRKFFGEAISAPVQIGDNTYAYEQDFILHDPSRVPAEVIWGEDFNALTAKARLLTAKGTIPRHGSRFVHRPDKSIRKEHAYVVFGTLG